MDEPRRIACFHLNQIGDLLFALPAIRGLRERYPQARITSIARPYLKDLLRLSGLVDEVIERARRPIGAGFRLAAELRRADYDLAVIFSTSLGMAVLARITGAPVRVGFDHPVSRLFVTKRVPSEGPPSMLNNFRLMEAIGCPVTKRDYVGLIHPGQAERDEAESVLRSAGIGADEPFAVLSPGASGRREIKCWSAEGFARVADGIARELGIRSVVVGLGSDFGICGLSANAVNLVGRTPLSTLAVVLERARVFIGVDSGVMHLAAAMRAPVVALFGPSDPEITGPLGEKHRIVSADVPCRPCHLSRCDRGLECMTAITPEMVLEAAAEQAGSQGRPCESA